MPMPKVLEELTLKNGKFFNQSGREVKVRVLGVDIATVGIFNPRPLFQNHEIPRGADAFVRGSRFDENAGRWSNFPRYVAPTIYLKKF